LTLHCPKPRDSVYKRNDKLLCLDFNSFLKYIAILIEPVDKHINQRTADKGIIIDFSTNAPRRHRGPESPVPITIFLA
jgi:hypothetical protein